MPSRARGRLTKVLVAFVPLGKPGELCVVVGVLEHATGNEPGAEREDEERDGEHVGWQLERKRAASGGAGPGGRAARVVRAVRRRGRRAREGEALKPTVSKSESLHEYHQVIVVSGSEKSRAKRSGAEISTGATDRCQQRFHSKKARTSDARKGRASVGRRRAR